MALIAVVMQDVEVSSCIRLPVTGLISMFEVSCRLLSNLQGMDHHQHVVDLMNHPDDENRIDRQFAKLELLAQISPPPDHLREREPSRGSSEGT